MADRNLKCPVDQTDMVMSARQGIEIDYCPNCRGVWLDRGELNKIIEKTNAPADAAASGQGAQAAPPAQPQQAPPTQSSAPSQPPPGQQSPPPQQGFQQAPAQGSPGQWVPNAPGSASPGARPGMSSPGMGSPGMGSPGMGAPGMGAPGMGGPGGAQWTPRPTHGGHMPPQGGHWQPHHKPHYGDDYKHGHYGHGRKRHKSFLEELFDD